MKNKLLYRVIPFLLIFSMVILCLPAIPVHATGYTVSGEWVFNDVPAIYPAESSSTYYRHYVDVNFTYSHYGELVNSLGFELINRKAYPSGTNNYLYCFSYITDYDSSTGDYTTKGQYHSTLETGWYDWTSRTIDFGDTPQSVPYEFYTWLHESATPVEENEMVATSTLLAGQYECDSSLMTGAYYDLSAWPSGLGSVDFSFTSSGVQYSQMSCRYDIEFSHGYCIYYDDTFAYSYGLTNSGFRQDSYGQIYLSSNQSVDRTFYDWFLANFTYVGDAEIIPSYSTVVNIYNTTGTSLLASYSLSGDSYAPFAEGVILENGLQMSDGSGNVWSWAEAGDPFYGFSLNPNSVLVAYGPGSTLIAGGYSADFVLNLYLVASLDEDDATYKTGVLGWFERLFDRLGDGEKNIIDSLSMNLTSHLLGLIDSIPIADFFLEAYTGFMSMFGFSNLTEGSDSPFSWLTEE